MRSCAIKHDENNKCCRVCKWAGKYLSASIFLLSLEQSLVMTSKVPEGDALHRDMRWIFPAHLLQIRQRV